MFIGYHFGCTLRTVCMHISIYNILFNDSDVSPVYPCISVVYPWLYTGISCWKYIWNISLFATSSAQHIEFLSHFYTIIQIQQHGYVQILRFWVLWSHYMAYNILLTGVFHLQFGSRITSRYHREKYLHSLKKNVDRDIVPLMTASGNLYAMRCWIFKIGSVAMRECLCQYVKGIC